MAFHDQLGTHGAAFAQLVEARESWTPEQLARELILQKYAVDQATFDAFLGAVVRDIEELRDESDDLTRQQVFHDLVALRRVRDALPSLGRVNGRMLEAERARLDDEEAERQRRRASA